jgi:hypothetical protein
MYNGNMKFCLAAILLFLTISLSGQKILMEFDSLPMQNRRFNKNVYRFNHEVLKEVSITGKTPKSVLPPQKNFWGNLALGSLTLFSGIITESADESLWMSESELSANDRSYNWKVDLYFPGTYVKSRERIRNDDGSWSVVTDKGLYVDWNNGAYGLIFEKGDTVGAFSLITNPGSDPESQKWLTMVNSDGKWVHSKIKKYEPLQMNYDFVVSGIIRGKNFLLITSGSHYRSLVLIENKPVAVFQNSPNFIILKKRDRIYPYLLYNSELTDIGMYDLIRLVMFNCLIANDISVDIYEM